MTTTRPPDPFLGRRARNNDIDLDRPFECELCGRDLEPDDNPKITTHQPDGDLVVECTACARFPYADKPTDPAPPPLPGQLAIVDTVR